MVKSCAALNCANRYSVDKSVSFHRFPADENLKAQWIKAIRRENFNSTKHSVICGKHFKEDDFLRKEPTNVLKSNAIPSVFDFAVHLKVKPPKKRRTIIRHPLPARNTQSDDRDKILDTEQPSTSGCSCTSLKRNRLYFGDYSEEELHCPQKAKMMWKLGKRQSNIKNKQLKILRTKNFRLNKKNQNIGEFGYPFKKKNRISEDCKTVLNNLNFSLKMYSERVRCRNFLQKEVDLLVELVEKSKILECKQMGAYSHKQKEVAWENLASKFNAHSGTSDRSVKNLKEKWANLKKCYIRNRVLDKQHSTGAWAGFSTSSPETRIDGIISRILDERMMGLPATCDSDTMDATEQIEPLEHIVLELPAENKPTSPSTSTPVNSDGLDSEVSEVNADLTDQTPSKSFQLDRKDKKRAGGSDTNRKWSELADEKKILAEIRQENLIEENKRRAHLHEVMMAQLVEEHQQKMQHAEQQHLLQMQLMREEHFAKIKELTK